MSDAENGTKVPPPGIFIRGDRELTRWCAVLEGISCFDLPNGGKNVTVTGPDSARIAFQFSRDEAEHLAHLLLSLPCAAPPTEDGRAA